MTHVSAVWVTWQRYSFLMLTAVHELLTSSMKEVGGMKGGQMQWVIRQGGRRWVVGPHGSQLFRHLQVLFKWSMSPYPSPSVSNMDPLVHRYCT